MPLTRSAGQRALAQNSSRRNPARQSRPNPSRTSRREREASSNSSESDSTGHGSKGSPKTTRHSISKTTPRGKANDRSRPVATTKSPSKRRQTASENLNQISPTHGPSWTDPRIPYQFWVDVFLYARDESGADAANTHWLLQAATLCKLLSEPALTAIYRYPVIRHASKAKRLVSLLERSPADTLFNYRRKIEYLHLNVRVVSQAVASQLIRPLTRLKELIFFNPAEQPPYRELDTHVRWNYSEDIFLALQSPPADDFEALSLLPIALRSWEWSGSLLGGYVADFKDIIRIHQMPSFAHLTRLSFTNFQVPSLRLAGPALDDPQANVQTSAEDDEVIDAIGDAIAHLQSLKHLVFESSTIMTSRLLSRLPTYLTHLELINCWEIDAENLAMFLITHGSSLRTLSLMHNQSLDLTFLTILAEACPSLQELRMNMSYYRHHDSLNDADPMYDFALLPDQIPTWPPSIRVIDIEHIRSWSIESVYTFIHSLVDNATSLPNLRELMIKTALDIPWQTRAELRHKLRDMLERVFLREDEDPHDAAAPKQTSDTHDLARPRKRKRSRSPRSPVRRSNRIEAHVRGSLRRPRRDNTSQRHGLGRPLYREPDTDEDEFDDTELSDAETQQSSSSNPQPELAVQGLCHTVNIIIDNQKTREFPYSMDDFLSDGEGSSGVEWDGDDDDDHDFSIAF
ncbi:hypothetical protein TRIATDRAFT_291876 [Trichoderma atroviride IMI 206040]|uniref:Uncharacterized protein n=1 Tax=Hypocrea atroviridis (strain ATCC 20476 / IMI 206040) TaxID=452589 RepID=G9NU22_HYPAI|nr:uncharacterized protein TRIATDRAFT_291876 [Trichoderma atroviride IMI 206040]EHK45559.1 hypothetical protein TRIATDRAFT_291876 [Trichoderma atroviride IMI 206040]